MRPVLLIAFGAGLAAAFLASRQSRFLLPRATIAGISGWAASGQSDPGGRRRPRIDPELLTAEQLERHARDLAAEHQVGRAFHLVEPLGRSLSSSERRLRAARAVLARSGQPPGRVTPAATWLLDNAHVVSEQLREIRQDLPTSYYRQLAKLTAGLFRGYPRVYAIARDLIAHTDARIDAELLVRYLVAYQTVAPLSIGELWATAIMLRVGLVEYLADLSTALVEASGVRADADAWAERLRAVERRARLDPEQVRAELRARYSRLPPAFAVRLLWMLREDEPRPALTALAEALERELTEEYGSVEAVYHLDHQQQAAIQVSISNTITSMRTLSTINWASWFERVSWTEQVLRQDPVGVYPRSTFATRDRYRHEVERLARRSGFSEVEVARRAVAHASRGAEGGGPPAHVGYYLVGAGRGSFARELGYRPAWDDVGRGLLASRPTATYLGGLVGVTAALVFGGLRLAGQRHLSRSALLGAALLAVPASEAAQQALNWSLSVALPPRVLPRLDLSRGIPAELRTIVVIPMLLLTEASVRGQLERLEVLSIAHADPHLHFALLSDFADAPAAEMPDDATLLDLAVREIEDLNARYGANRFFLFHRRRVWNPGQSCYMGWERKRGKLEEFNHLLRGSKDTTFVTRIGEQDVLSQIRYVITLDADTQLPRDAAGALVGTLAHPLNHAVVDPVSRRVVAGYGILQPRVAATLPSANRSRFARLFAGAVGLDPYTAAVSNTYMDLFGEGTYAGKGIYDPAILCQVLDARFPENALLSHDLIEGNYARVGFLSDVELLDSYPPTNAAFAVRHHRWVRGDWQVAPWLLPRVPTARGWETNPLPVMDRFKIFDNLRRSLVAPGSVALIAAGPLVLPGRPASVVGQALLPLAMPLVLGVLDRLRALARSPNRSATLRSAADDLALDAARFGVNVALLAHQAGTNADAIARTLYRLLVSRRDLLEWETAEQTERQQRRPSRRHVGRRAPLAALPLLLDDARRHQARGARSVLPVVATWLVAPNVARWLDQPLVRPDEAPGPEQGAMMRRLARGYWHFFETFVDETGNHLAPDNFQENPRPVIAYRTSPTNIGLQLLADLAAHDLGYVGVRELTARTERVFATLARLERYRGHLLNWYDTQSLKTLPPAYVSTVDSGNLAGHLLVLAQGYRERRGAPILDERVLAGLADTVVAVRSSLRPIGGLDRALLEISRCLESHPQTVREYRALLRELRRRSDEMPAEALPSLWIARLREQIRSWLDDLESLVPPGSSYEDGPPPSLGQLALNGGAAREEPAALLTRHDAIVETARKLVEEMDFRFLYDEPRGLFTIGYNVADNRRDGSYYDLLASEARLASYLAIARGEVPTEHWFQLGRPLTSVGSRVALVSWGGTMFEYLMPLLVMRTFPDTLLDVTYQAVVDRQIAYGREHGVPWGVSESAYDVRDASGNYQYRSFGVPGLGLRADLAGDLVVAPYATALAVPVRLAAALANLRTLARDGLAGSYGLYEAVDYTRDRLPPDVNREIIRSYMAHHQGMSLLALDNALNGKVMQRRFHADPLAKSAELLLQERFPRDVPTTPLPEPVEAPERLLPRGAIAREFSTPNTVVPATQLLSNGTYTVLVTNSGAGLSTTGDHAITRWRPDTTCDEWGSFVYLRDVRSGATWSATYQPTRHFAEGYRVVMGLHKAEFHQRVAGIETVLEVAVSAEDDVEVRQVTLTNRTSAPREIELTSYVELVLGPLAADEAHPAFGKLFVETEFVPEHEALLASRRPRASGQPRAWAFHAVEVRGHAVGAIQYETDRAAFRGRNGGRADPAALHGRLGRSVGPVLDPIFSLRRRVRLVPGGTAQVTFSTGVAPSRDDALRLTNTYRAPGAAARVFELAWAGVQAELHDLGLSADEAHRFQRLARSALYVDPRMRAPAEILEKNSRGQSGLWGYGISGDYPIVLVRVSDADELGLVQELVLAHQYWRLKRLAVDLVILLEKSTGYRQVLQDEIVTLVRTGRSMGWLNRPGGIFVVSAGTMPEEDRVLLRTVARVDLAGWRGPLVEQLPQPSVVEELRPRHRPARPVEPPPSDLPPAAGFGSFSADGREFVVDLPPGCPTPAPWINVIANERYGFIVSESGGGYTWAENSQQNRLTPWSNDPVVDPTGEALYLRDEVTGAFWSPVPHPAGSGHFRARHGYGYSTFENESGDIASEVTLFVPRLDSVKIYRVRLRNRSDGTRHLSATYYVEWTLGPLRTAMAPYVITSRDGEVDAIFARNPYNAELPGRVAFVAASAPIASATGDRAEFIGRNGSLHEPAALARPGLEGRFGAGLDPCGAFCCNLDLGPGEERELIFLLGEGDDIADARRLVRQYREPAAAAAAFAEVTGWWQSTLEVVQVHTPDPALDLVLNGWLLYQATSCRLWGRSAFYQSGGAYGFRDQLQDVMALVHAEPEQSRAQILRAARRQFVEGDAQHWWHPPSGRGVRTRCSDDYLWLPFVAHQYVRATGDAAILDETVPFLTGRPVGPDEAEYYDLPTLSDERASLYAHCCRALDLALTRLSPRGLPLMGSGDWNDGMNLVGIQGKGESIWVGWFLYLNLTQFADVAAGRGDAARAERYRSAARSLQQALEEHGWDGAWYRRAYFDDGTPLGSNQNEECRIDSIAQSWAVISGAADPDRARRAMAAVDEHLVDEAAGLIKLLTPPFDHAPLEPGYIKGYVPGVRENGGQYTHAATWVIWAWAMLDDGERAHRLFAMLNPVRHLAGDSARYKVEPYVVAADVYAAPPHVGRGGWTWYTGSAGWTYRLGLEMLLGLRREGNELTIVPCVPPSWPRFELRYRHGRSTYHILVENPQGVSGGPTTIEIDGTSAPSGRIPLNDDGVEHRVRVVLSGQG